MSEQNKALTDDEHVVPQSEICRQLNTRLDDVRNQAQDQFDNGQRAGGFGAVGRYFLTFLYTGLLRGNFLRGRRGLIACAIAAQDAYNRAAMIYCISVQEK